MYNIQYIYICIYVYREREREFRQFYAPLFSVSRWEWMQSAKNSSCMHPPSVGSAQNLVQWLVPNPQSTSWKQWGHTSPLYFRLLKHYLRCEPFWILLYSVTEAFCTKSLSGWSMCWKCCWVCHPFQAYHALRNTFSREIDSAFLHSEFTHIVIIACDVLSHWYGATRQR